MPQPPKLIPDYFLFNGSGAGNQNEAEIVATAQGGIAVSFTIPGVDGTDRSISRHRTDGSAVINLAQTVAGAQKQTALAYTAADYGIRVWTSNEGGTDDIFAEIVAPSAGLPVIPLVEAFLVNTDQTAGIQAQPQVVAMGERFFIAWIDVQTQRVRGTIVDTAGTVVRAPFDISTGNVTHNNGAFELSLTVLSNSNVVVAYRLNSFDTVFRIVTSTGFATAEIDYDGAAANTGAGVVVTLADGRFALVTLDANGGGLISGHIYTSTGVLSVAEFNVLAAGDFPDAVALPDGRFFVVAVSGGDIVGQMMNSDGTKDGASFVVNSVTTGTQDDVDVALTADGLIAITWRTTESGSDDIKVAIFDPREEGISLVGTPLADSYLGSAFGDIISTGADNDTVNAAGGDDIVSGGLGQDTLNGGDGNDRLDGNAGNDTLDGGSGNDSMAGGLGNDKFYADVFSDVVTEAAGQGTDRVQALNSYTLGAGQEIEILESTNISGTAAQNLSGNDLAQTITGNNGFNILEGFGGDDVLNGAGGDDYLSGGTGNDTMDGGDGNDVYFVDSQLDQVNEVAGFGNDRIVTSGTFVLNGGSSIETLETLSLSDNTPMNLTGNELAQTITGNNGSNFLTSGGGADVMIAAGGNDYLIGNASAGSQMQGGTGNDTFYVFHAGDTIVEAASSGTDRVAVSVNYTLNAGAHVEQLEAADLGAVTALSLAGNEFAQSITGNAGNNRINGGGGNDTLQGLGGSDTLIFTTALGAGNVDQIVGFASGSDKIELDDAIFTQLAAGALPASAFKVGAAANEADDRIVYNSTTGALLYDADGDGAGAAVQFATLVGGPALAASDFVVV